MKRGVPRPEPDKEAEANAFAMSLLMPERFVKTEVMKLGKKIDLCDDRWVKTLARTFQVSETLMAIRIGQVFKLKV